MLGFMGSTMRRGADTKLRIIRAARACFGRSGYDLTTNKDIAAEAGVTTGALYHYFDSKPDLFVAVHEELTALVVDEFARVAAAETTLAGQIRVILERAVELNREDPSLGMFSTIAPIELQRHPEVAAMVENVTGIPSLFARLVREARARGELADDVDTDATVGMLLATAMGLAQFGALVESADIHHATTEAFIRLADGSMFRTGDRREPPTVSRRG